MSKTLNISKDQALPLSAVTATTVVYGGKGMGKTNFGAVFVEELAAAGLRWCFIDPMGVAWGMRHSADGKGPGVECLILGGAHGDIPIEPTGGAVVADLVADHNVSVILDISRKANGEMWSIGERIRFMTDYGRQLFKRQGALVDGRRREPICQIIDEAARFVPQMVRAGDTDAAKCESVWSAIVEEGRNIGIGVVLLTQRSARLNKNVAELADLMLAFRTVGPNSLEAVLDWLGAHVPKERLKTLAEQVRSLEVGSALAVSPGWLKIEKVVAIRKRTTFDSSATPKPGEQAVRVKGDGAKPDLAVYAARMKETIERAKADDPKELKRRIAELESAAKKAAPVARSVEDKALIEQLRTRQKLLQEDLELVNRELSRHVKERRRMRELVSAMAKLLDAAESEAESPETRVVPRVQAIEVAREYPVKVERVRPATLAIAADGPGEKMGKALRSILTVLAQHGASSKNKIAAATGYAASGGGFGNALSEGRTKGWLRGSDHLEITKDGPHALGTFEPLPTGEELLRQWLGKLGKAEREILSALAAEASGSMTKDQLAAATGYAASGGGFGNALSRLRTLELIEGKGEISLQREFAEAIG